MTFPKILRPILTGACLALLLAGCSSNDDEEYIERTVEELYNRGMDLVHEGSYKTAAKAFDEVERQHPYSVWATKAQLMAAYALYENNNYDDAINALDRFIQLHPSNRDVGYAYYLKALCYYDQIADVRRDQAITQHSLKSLQEVVDRFPTSVYARDARLKIDLARDHLAGKEMAVGRWYLQQKQYLAAINRFRTVVDHYQTTTHVPEALHRLVEAYRVLGLDAEANRAASVLGHNFPGSEWYVDTYVLVEAPEAKSFEDQSGFRKSSDWFDWAWPW